MSTKTTSETLVDIAADVRRFAQETKGALVIECLADRRRLVRKKGVTVEIELRPVIVQPGSSPLDTIRGRVSTLLKQVDPGDRMIPGRVVIGIRRFAVNGAVYVGLAIDPTVKA